MAVHPNLQVKAILLKEGVEDGPKEIRRFRLGEEKSGGVKVGLLRSLLASVHSAFNVDSQIQRCSLFWKDQDGDLVQFSTEEELTHALAVNHDDTFRLYVTLSGGDPEDKRREKEAESEKHVSFEVHIPDAEQDQSQDQPGDHCTDPAELTRLGCPGQHKANKGQGNRKAWKAACKAGKKMMNPALNKEFNQVRQQVPEEFRCWVRQFVRLWTNQGPEAAFKAFATPTPTTPTTSTPAPADKKKKLPAGISDDFPQWLHVFLCRYHASHLSSSPCLNSGDQADMMEVEGEEMPGEGDRLEGLPPVYYRWICLFLPRFRAKFGLARAILADSEGEETRGGQGESEGQKKKGHGKGQGKRHCHGAGKEDKQRGTLFAASSESEESDGGKKKALKSNVPKEFRQFARQTVIQLHKKKGNNSESKKKATQAGLTAEIQEFIEQILMEFHGKLTNRRPRAVSMEMVSEERALPVGVAQEHFLWLCRFLLRWHWRHAGKCDIMSGWSSGESTTTTDDDEEEMHGHRHGHHHHPHPHHYRHGLRAAMRKARHMPHGMMGMGPFRHPHHHPPHFAHAMNTAGGPPPAGFFGCPLPAGCYGPPHSFSRCGNKRCGNMWAGGPWAAWQDGNGFGKRWKQPKKDAAAANATNDDGAQGGEEIRKATDSQDDAVGRVTESMKKM